MRIRPHRPIVHRPLRALVTAALAVAIAAPATALATAGPAAAASTTGVTSNQITIGATVPLTGPAAPGYSEIAPAMNAVFKWVDAHGGVHGRKIKYIYLDDKYNPATTAKLTRQLVLQDHIFADVGSLGTPTQLSVQKYLNRLKIPQLFIESGCNCWSTSKYPYSLGWQPPYTVDGKLLGYYVKQHFAGKKIGELFQDTEFGKDVMKGFEMEVPASQIVQKETYNVTTLSGPLSNQMAALKAAGATVVVMATIPAGTALAMLPAASIGYTPQYLLDNVGADAPTVGPLLASFTQTATHTSNLAKSTAGLLNGVITDAYMPPEGTTANPWVQVASKLLQKYAPTLWKSHGLDGNTEYGISLAYTFVQALDAAGKNLTRTGLMKAIAQHAKQFATPGLVPLSYTGKVHYGYEGGEIVQISSSAPAIKTPTGTWPGTTVLSPVYTTSPGSGAVRKYTGKQPAVPAKLRTTS